MKALEALEQVSWGGGGCPVPGNTQSQVKLGSEQSDSVEDVPACGRWGGGE